MMKSWMGALCLLLLSPFVTAEEFKQDPYQVVQVVADRAFKRFTADQAIVQQNLEHLKVIVEDEMMPYVDYKYAAYKVMGPELKKTTPEQREQFTAAFRQYMVTTFAQAFTEYKDQTIEFAPARPFDGQNIVTVGLTIVDPSRPDITVQFKARRSKKTGEWKAFDLIAEGISLLAAKEKEISGLIRRDGVDSVIALLKEKSATALVRKGLTGE